MRVPSTGRRRRLAAFAAAAASAVALLVHVYAPVAADRPASAAPRTPAAGTGRRRLPRRRRRPAAPARPALGRRHSAATSRARGDHHPGQRRPAARALARRAPRPRRTRRAPTLGRARSPASSSVRRSGPTRPPLGADPQVTGPGWVSGPGRTGATWSTTPRSSTGWSTPTSRATRSASTAARSRASATRSTASPRAATGAGRRSGSTRSTGTARCSPPTRSSTASARALADGMARHLERFLAGAVGHGAKAGNLGPGLRFHYLPHRGLRTRSNVDSPEYANIVLSFSRFYGLARDAGMRPPAQLGLLREWVRRVIAGYWTHGGYLELGHRPRLPSLAPAQEDRAGAAGPDRRRGATRAPARPAVGRVGQVAARPRADRLRRAGRARAADPGAARLRREHGPREPRQRLPRRHAHRGQRDARARGRPRPPRGRRPPALYSYDPDTGRWPSRRPPTTPRSCRSTRARSRTAASTSPGSSTAGRRSRRTSAAPAARPSA